MKPLSKFIEENKPAFQSTKLLMENLHFQAVLHAAGLSLGAEPYFSILPNRITITANKKIPYEDLIFGFEDIRYSGHFVSTSEYNLYAIFQGVRIYTNLIYSAEIPADHWDLLNRLGWIVKTPTVWANTEVVCPHSRY